MGASQSTGDQPEVEYQQIGGDQVDIKEDEYELKDGPMREYDCVIVFSHGSSDEFAQSETEIFGYDYLSLMEPKACEERRANYHRNVPNTDFLPSRPKQSEFFGNERKLIIDLLTNKVGLDCSQIDELVRVGNEDRYFWRVGMSEMDARKFAEKFQATLKIDPDVALAYLNLQDDSLAKEQLMKEADGSLTEWNDVYARYFSDVSPEIYLHRRVPMSESDSQNYDTSLFRIRDRCKLMQLLFSQPTINGGTGINVDVLKKQDHCITDLFPIHSISELKPLSDQMIRLLFWVNFPVDKFADYFNNEVGSYFAMCQIFLYYGFPLIMAGLIAQCFQLAANQILITGIEFFGLAVVVWIWFFPIYWRGSMFNYGRKWGLLSPQLIEPVQIPANDTPILTTLKEQSHTILAFTIMTSLAGAIAVIQVIVNRAIVSGSDSINFNNFWLCIFNALAIYAFDQIYCKLGPILNQWSAPPTETPQISSRRLVTTLFVTRFINAFTYLYYLALFRKFDISAVTCLQIEGCFHDIRTQLFVICLKIIICDVSTGVLQLTKSWFNNGIITTSEYQSEADRIRREYNCSEIKDVIIESMNIVLMLGYCSLFVISCPGIIVFVALGLIMQMRVYGYRLCNVFRRPFEGSILHMEDLFALWEWPMKVIAWSALFTNAFWICVVIGRWTWKVGVSAVWKQQLLAAVLLSALMLIGGAGLALQIPRIPSTIRDHLSRQSHIDTRVLPTVARRITNYFNYVLTEKHLLQWKHWSISDVSDFLRATLLQNKLESGQMAKIFERQSVDGQVFSTITDEELNSMLRTRRPLPIATFVLDTRDRLENQNDMAASQIGVLQHIVSRSKDQMSEAEEQFLQFDSELYSELSDFCGTMLTGQCKRQLWDLSHPDSGMKASLHELSGLLYYTIALFIRIEYPASFNDIIPTSFSIKDTNQFVNKVINPMKSWLNHWKLTKDGLSFEEFCTEFPEWIHEYYLERSKQHKHMSLILESSESHPLLSNAGGTMKRYLSVGLHRDEWSPECNRLLKQISMISYSFTKYSQTDKETLYRRIESTAYQGKDMQHFLHRLIYAVIAHYIRTDIHAPNVASRESIHSLLDSLVSDISPKLSDPGRISLEEFNRLNTYLDEYCE